MPGTGEEPLGSPDDVLARLRLRARIAAAEAEFRPGAAHARPRSRLAPSRWAVGGAAVVVALAVAGLAVPSLLAAGDQVDPPAFGADSTLVSWEASAGASTAAGGAGAEAATLVVHVAGAVASPGVFELDEGARVADAIEQAGGATAEADLDALNLAARLADGQRVYVTKPGETPPAVLALDGGGSGAGGSAGAGAGAGGSDGAKVNVNQAGIDGLTALPGIGPVLAQRIVDFREANGPFEELNDLAEVSGIGPKVLAGLADSVAF
ncbi:MAG: helix-hairpin-helix domain-containing protein [Bifidobacteriaceae bacterium]|jgi:competence protein ComEA|nr:helix-hairpin-helix domain-containing protein [Bifidobacteriaceae bacterium]